MIRVKKEREVGEMSYVFMGIVSMLKRYTKKHNVIEMFSDRNAAESCLKSSTDRVAGVPQIETLSYINEKP